MKYLTVTPFKEFGKFPKLSGDRILPSQVKQHPQPTSKADNRRIHITKKTTVS
jgi:hypothetical protein